MHCHLLFELTDITSGNISRWVQISMQFCHEGLAEAPNFTLAFPLWIEV